MNVKWFMTARCIQYPLRAVRGMRRGCRVIRASPHPSARKPGLCAPVPFPHVCTMVSKILPPGVRGRRSIIKTDVANSITECLSIQQRMSNFVPIMGF